MKHSIIPASWKSAAALKKTIKEMEKQGWSVVALGDVSGSNMLILANNGEMYEHEVIQIFWSLKGKIIDIISEKQEEGWKIATIGACLGSSLMIMKRKIESESAETEDTAESDSGSNS